MPRLVGGSVARVVMLRGDASSRRYYRIEVERGSVPSLVVMELPQSGGSDETTKGTPPRQPFVDMLEFLRSGDLPVPELYSYDDTAGLIYLEDLGDATMESLVVNASPEARRGHYLEAIDLLACLQRFGESRSEGCIAYGRRFDHDLLRWELDHFLEWLLCADRGVKLTDGEHIGITAEFDAIAHELAAAPTTFVHRDFQSRNLMVQADGLRLIDFQDALIGPLPYDLVGLLRDSYAVLTSGEVDSFVDAYLARRPFSGGDVAFRRWFDLQTVQRKLKDAGRFIYIDRVRRNPTFLPFVLDSLVYVRQALARLPDRARLIEILAAHLPEFADPSGR